MKAILSDVCIETQVRMLAVILTGPIWQDIWARLGLQCHLFRDIGLAADTPDIAVWDYCQREQMVLVTANRNQDGPDSLETAIRTRSTPDSLPVFTIADAEEIVHSRQYADRVVESMLTAILDIDNLRGTGRVWLP